MKKNKERKSGLIGCLQNIYWLSVWKIFTVKCFVVWN